MGIRSTDASIIIIIIKKLEASLLVFARYSLSPTVHTPTLEVGRGRCTKRVQRYRGISTFGPAKRAGRGGGGRASAGRGAAYLAVGWMGVLHVLVMPGFGRGRPRVVQVDTCSVLDPYLQRDPKRRVFSSFSAP